LESVVRGPQDSERIHSTSSSLHLAFGQGSLHSTFGKVIQLRHFENKVLQLSVTNIVSAMFC
jgi:hypothetical protein